FVVVDGRVAGRTVDGPTHGRRTLRPQSRETPERRSWFRSQQPVAGRYRSATRRPQARRAHGPLPAVTRSTRLAAAGAQCLDGDVRTDERLEQVQQCRGYGLRSTAWRGSRG